MFNRAATAAESAARHGRHGAGGRGRQPDECRKPPAYYEEARSKYIDNRLKGTKTYFEMKQVQQGISRGEQGTASHFRTALPAGQRRHAQVAHA